MTPCTVEPATYQQLTCFRACFCVCLQAFLPLALTAASRMLEPLLTNTETGRQFVDRGGADVLLKLYQLPKLTVSGQASAYN